MQRWGSLIAVCVTIAVLALRAPETFALPQFWAEDGALMYAGMKNVGPSSLFDIHAGTLHIIPRLISWIACAFPAGSAPAIHAAGAVAVTCWATATIAQVANHHALAFAILFMLVPGDALIFGSATHIQWIMAPALAAIAASPAPSTEGRRVNQVAFVIAAGFTGPVGALSLPLWALRLWHDRDRFSQGLSGIGILIGVAGLLISTFAYQKYQGPGFDLHTAGVMAYKVFGTLANGTAFQTGLISIVAAVTLACVAVWLVLASPHRQFFVAVSIFAGAMMMAGLMRMSPLKAYFDHTYIGDRYFFFPRLVLIWIVYAAIADGKELARAAGLVVAAVIAVNYWHWKRFPQADLKWSAEALKIDHGEAVSIPIHPPGWKVNINAR
ncbi:MAG: hypothetical protein U1E81_09680 [Xanthobacteraceae bacterium]